MKVDVATLECGKYGVFPREGAPERYDGEYETDPLFGPAEEDECIDWCDASGHQYRMRRRVALVPEMFIGDVEAKADKCMSMIRDKKLVVESDVIYKASAAWKENPTHYAYSGDFGGHARLQPAQEGECCTNAEWADARGILRELFGMATALWELGFTLTFDKDGKHTIFGAYPQWVTVDND